MINNSGITPRGNKVLIRPEQLPEKTSGGIVIPDEALDRQQMAHMYATVIGIGPWCWKDEPEPRCEVGDRVIYAKYSGEPFTGNDGITYRLINAREIVATHIPPVNS